MKIDQSSSAQVAPPPPHRRERLTTLLHRRWAEIVQPGDRLIDATVGKGFDTAELARLAGPNGEVAGFDIQPEAIAIARARLAEVAPLVSILWFQQSHEQMIQALPHHWLGRVRLIAFNLGYLPGSDHKVITQPHSTLAALDQSMRLLMPGGWISLMLYHNHPGGTEECTAVLDWAAQLPSSHETESPPPPAPSGPRILLVRKPESEVSVH